MLRSLLRQAIADKALQQHAEHLQTKHGLLQPLPTFDLVSLRQVLSSKGKHKLTSKESFCLRAFVLGRVPTKTLMAQHYHISDLTCPLGCIEQDDVTHILKGCQHSTKPTESLDKALSDKELFQAPGLCWFRNRELAFGFEERWVAKMAKAGLSTFKKPSFYQRMDRSTLMAAAMMALTPALQELVSRACS